MRSWRGGSEFGGQFVQHSQRPQARFRHVRNTELCRQARSQRLQYFAIRIGAVVTSPEGDFIRDRADGGYPADGPEARRGGFQTCASDPLVGLLVIKNIAIADFNINARRERKRIRRRRFNQIGKIARGAEYAADEAEGLIGLQRRRRK